MMYVEAEKYGKNLEKNKAGSHSEERQNAELKRYAVWPLLQCDMKT
jgi:hypothetical protein